MYCCVVLAFDSPSGPDSTACSTPIGPHDHAPHTVTRRYVLSWCLHPQLSPPVLVQRPVPLPSLRSSYSDMTVCTVMAPSSPTLPSGPGSTACLTPIITLFILWHDGMYGHGAFVRLG